MQQRNHSILVIDDDTDIGHMLRLMLEYKGYTVTVCERADQVEEVLQLRTFHLVILDMLLSGVNGTDICRQLNDDPRYCSIPVIMISAHPNAEELCLQAGATDFISKPFEMDHILSSISRLVDHEK